MDLALSVAYGMCMLGRPVLGFSGGFFKQCKEGKGYRDEPLREQGLNAASLSLSNEVQTDDLLGVTLKSTCSRRIVNDNPNP